MSHNDLERKREAAFYLERLVRPAISYEERSSAGWIFKITAAITVSTLERTSEIEAPFILKRARSLQPRSNLMKVLIEANIFGGAMRH